VKSLSRTIIGAIVGLLTVTAVTAEMTDQQIYAEAPNGIADEAKPVALSCIYLRQGELSKFKRILSKEALAYFEQQLAADKDSFSKLQKREKELPFDVKSTTYHVVPQQSVNKELADFGPDVNPPRMKEGIETITMETPTQSGARGPNYVVKEGGLWRLAVLDGMPPTTIWDKVPQ